MRLILPIFLLAGCQPYELQNKAPSTAYLCNVASDGNWDDTSVFAFPDVSSECVDAILNDFNAEDELRVYNLSDSENFDDWGTAAGTLVGGAWALLHYDWEINHPALNDSIFDAELLIGEKPDGWTLYNIASSRFSKTQNEPSDRYAAAYSRTSGALKLDEGFTPLKSAALIVHESKHAEGFRHVRCEDTGMRDCDDDYLGAYGATLAIFNAINTDDEVVNEYIAGELHWINTRIQL